MAEQFGPEMPPPQGEPYPMGGPGPEKKRSKTKIVVLAVGGLVVLSIFGRLGQNPSTEPIKAPAGSSASSSPTTSTQSPEDKAKAEAEAKAAADKAAAEAKAAAEKAAAEKAAAEKAAAEKAAAEKARLAALKNPKSYASISDRSFSLIAKTPDKYVGKKYILYGYVTQFDAATGPDTFRANLAGNKKSDWFDYDTNCIVRVDDSALVENVVQDDLVTLYVEVVGSLTYDTQIGGSTTVPEVKAHIIRVTGSTK